MFLVAPAKAVNEKQRLVELSPVDALWDFLFKSCPPELNLSKIFPPFI